jgi:hypothetical protein
VRNRYEAGSKKLKAKFLSRLRILAQLEIREWNENFYKTLAGECDGLSEIRFEADHVQQRPLGFRSGPYEFTLLLWAMERNDRFVPLSACEIALKWKARAIINRSLTDALWLALE